LSQPPMTYQTMLHCARLIRARVNAQVAALVGINQ